HIFFFNATSTPEFSPLSLHAALPISGTWSPVISTGHEQTRSGVSDECLFVADGDGFLPTGWSVGPWSAATLQGSAYGGLLTRLRSEEHTSELQSLTNLVCRLLLEKKN